MNNKIIYNSRHPEHSEGSPRGGRIFNLIICLLLIICFIPFVQAATNEKNYYRNFWSPMYSGLRLNYCTMDGKTCGLPVASQYCRMMGYEKADQVLIDNNVGLTHYPLCRAICKGWTCNGFKLIRCVGRILHKPPQGYYYRSRRFVFPRFSYYRVAWCYEGESGCGERAAYSFCRRMGYMRTTQFKKDEQVAATKALGDQKLCFGDRCVGFKEIVCYR